MNKKPLFKAIISGIVSGIVIYTMLAPLVITADVVNSDSSTQATLVKDGKLTICMLDRSNYQVVKTVTRIITNYTSDPNETDDTPNITASGKHVEDGIVATNDLPFGTKIKIPDLYGDKIFTVEDRMHARKKGMIDVWTANKDTAIRFGARTAKIQVLAI